MKKIILLTLAAIMLTFSLVGCQAAAKKVDFSSADGLKDAVIVAEKESAGEEVALSDALFANAKYTPVDTQAKALVEVSSGSADAALIDYVMSIGSIGEGTDFADLSIVAEKEFSPEQYGVAFRKGSDMAYEVNKVIAELKADGTLAEIAKKYKLEDLLLGDDAFEAPEAGEESDWAYIQEKGELIVGITYFAPMNYFDENNELVGFETEFAKAVCEKLGVTAKFQEISWETKEIELEAKSIDCIWNGMTITEERIENMSITIPYMENKQILVTKAAAK